MKPISPYEMKQYQLICVTCLNWCQHPLCASITRFLILGPVIPGYNISILYVVHL